VSKFNEVNQYVAELLEVLERKLLPLGFTFQHELINPRPLGRELKPTDRLAGLRLRISREVTTAGGDRKVLGQDVAIHWDEFTNSKIPAASRALMIASQTVLEAVRLL
jgi:hypothetical protein